jgi:parallel beta-helix repeat protein
MVFSLPCESVEDQVSPLRPNETITVTSRTDAGTGSLRQALLSAIPGDIITFDTAVFPPTGPMTITLLSALPEISIGNLTIDGSHAGVVLDGQYLSSGDGFHITSDGNTIRGLHIINFPNDGVEITNGAQYNTIGGDWTVGSAPHGEGNVITLNGEDGININGAGTMSNTVSGNLLGLDVDGTRDFRVQAMAISPDYANDQTLFVGARFDGVWKTTDGGGSWVEVNSGLAISDVQSLAISPDYANDGTVFAGTTEGGIFKTTDEGGSWARVDSEMTSRDVSDLAISPNYASDGCLFAATGGDGLFVSTDKGGTWAARSSGLSDLNLSALAISPDYDNDRTLFATSGEGVYKSVNQGYNWDEVKRDIEAQDALVLSPNYANDQTLFVGRNHCDGCALLKSTDGGGTWVSLGEGGWFDTEALAISPNYTVDQTIFAGAYGIGLFKSSTGGASWLQIKEAAHSNALSLSPTYAEDATLFLGQDRGKIMKSVNGGNTWLNISSGLTEQGSETGVRISDGAQRNRIGGERDGERNVISHNHHGIVGTDTLSNIIQGNYIGTDARGTAPLANTWGGISIIGGSYNQVKDNLISGNNDGVNLDNTSMHNVISSNYIGTDISGTAKIGNRHGIAIGGPHNTIGGNHSDQGNLISGNEHAGISLSNGAYDNVIMGNLIGTDASGTAALGNEGVGIRLFRGGGVYRNRIGGVTSGERNIISGNSGNGIWIETGAMTNTVIGNYIGTDISGRVAIPNIEGGIMLWGGQFNVIGGSTPAERNVISGNSEDGVQIRDTTTLSNIISSNYIGTDVDGTNPLANERHGISIESSRGNTIAHNTIAYNASRGIYVNGVDAVRNTITQNSIHSNVERGIVLEDGNTGLTAPLITDVTSQTIGGIAPMAYITVEVFSDAEDEGRVYEGTTSADGSGVFTLNKLESFTGPYLTATATDSDGNTSEFSAPKLVAACVGLSDVSISGIDGGYTEVDYTFTALPVPDNATLPITYTWSSDGLTSGQGTANAAYHWATTGIQTVSVTVENCDGSAHADHGIILSEPPPDCPRPLSDVTLTGPTNGYTDTQYTFNGGITPADATAPVTLTWSPAPLSGQGTLTAIYQWATPGTYSITLTAENCGGTETATQTITIYTPTPGCPRPLTSVAISGPTDGEVGTAYTFDTVITPADATSPITYTWSLLPPGTVLLPGRASATYTWDAPGSYTLTLRAENCGGAVTATHTIAITPLPVPSDYEPNDTCAQARFIATDGVPQVHTFQDEGDEDWIAFQATAGITYVIEARVPPTSRADVMLEMYDSCTPGDDSFDDENPTFNPDIRFVFPSPASGMYYLRLFNYLTTTYGSDVVYHLSVQALQHIKPAGAVILVAGRYRAGDSLQQNIYNITDALYAYALNPDQGGCRQEQIAYLAPESRPGTTGVATKVALQEAITQWAVGRLEPGQSLTLYMFDHGRVDRFYLDGVSGELLSPQELDGWLDQLEATVPGVAINVIIEACHSGSFIEAPQSLSGDGRVVIASTAPLAVAYASQTGAVFSDAFINSLQQTPSLWTAFDEGVWGAHLSHPDQVPWLDDTGNRQPNEVALDGRLAARRAFACMVSTPQENWPPHITGAAFEPLVGEQVRLWAAAQDDEHVATVWSLIHSPSWQRARSSEELIADPEPVILPRRQDGFGGQYMMQEGMEIGMYRVVFHAQDSKNLAARPFQVKVCTGDACVEPGMAQTIQIPIDGLTTTVAIPTGAVTATTAFTYVGFTDLSGLGNLTGLHQDLEFAGRGFNLAAYQWGQLQLGLMFQHPVTMTLRYSDADVAGLDESTLALYWLDNDTWRASGVSVTARLTATNELVVTTEHVSTFALFGQAPVASDSRVYLPLVLREWPPIPTGP